MAAPRPSPLRTAILVGVVGATLLGLRDALSTLEVNAFAQPARYILTYLAAPVLLDFIWIIPIALASLAAAWIRGWPREPRAQLRFFAAPWGFLIALTGLAPSAITVADRLRQVGATIPGAQVVLWIIVIALSCAAAYIVAAAASVISDDRLRALSAVAGICLGLAALCVVPVARFFLTEMKWVRDPASVPGPRSDQPNVLLISVDTLRADHLGVYGAGGDVTPSIDQLGRQGVVFEQAFSAAPWTLPSMASLMTGLDVRHHGAGAITNGRDPLGRAPLPVEPWTLASVLSASGYRTHAIVTNPYLSLHYGLGRGFQSYENVTIESETSLILRRTLFIRLIDWLRPNLLVGDTGQTVSARADDWLVKGTREQPFFLWLHYIDPHPPYRLPSVARHKSFRGDTLLGGAETVALDVSSPDVARLRSGEIRLDAAEKDRVRALYGAEVTTVDAAIGSVLRTVDRLGLRDRTLVLFTADHGEEFWEHGGVEHGHTVYDELLHVPLILRWPGHLPESRRVAALVRLVDVAPTLLALAGVSPPGEVDGITMLPLVEGTADGARTAIAANLLFAEERVAFRTEEYKYIRWENGKEELYHLPTDPEEKRDLAGSDERLGRLRDAYLAWSDDHAGPAPRRATAPLDGSTEEALRALGYLR